MEDEVAPGKAGAEVARVADEVAEHHGGSSDPEDGLATLAPRRREPQATFHPIKQ